MIVTQISNNEEGLRIALEPETWKDHDVIGKILNLCKYDVIRSGPPGEKPGVEITIPWHSR